MSCFVVLGNEYIRSIVIHRFPRRSSPTREPEIHLDTEHLLSSVPESSISNTMPSSNSLYIATANV